MPLIDVTEVLLDVDFADTFNVIRRSETVNNDGLSVVTPATFANVVGVVYSKGDDNLNRRAEYDATMKQIIVVTGFALQASSPGFKPDLIQWPPTQSQYYVVERLEDFSRYGSGFVRARCTSIQYQDAPPVIEMPTGW